MDLIHFCTGLCQFATRYSKQTKSSLLFSNIARFVNASVQTPNKLLRMVAEEICGQSARKPHAERDFKVRLVSVTVVTVPHFSPFLFVTRCQFGSFGGS